MVSGSWDFACFQFLNFAEPNSDSAFWLGGVLVPNTGCSRSVMASVPLSPPSTCGVSFHHNGGRLGSFSGQFFLLVGSIWFLLVFPAINCFPLTVRGGRGSGERT